MNQNRDLYLNYYFQARLMIIILGLLTGLALFLWAKEIFSMPIASITSSMFLLSPNILAHSHLATIDTGCMFTIFLSIYLFRKIMEDHSYKKTIITGFFWGVALLVKYTAIILLPLFIFLIFFSSPKKNKINIKKRLKRLFILIPIIISALLTINGLMQFQGSFKTLDQYLTINNNGVVNSKFASSFMKQFQSLLPDAIPVPLPENYILGFDAQKADTEAGEFGSYLMGEWSEKGWYYYNLIALMVKIPLPVVLIFSLSLFYWKKQKVKFNESLTIFSTIVLFLIVMSIFNKLNIGIRYMLPIFPFFYLIMGSFFQQIWEKKNIKKNSIILCFLFLYYSNLIIQNHPAYLSYFNVLAGGSENGDYWLIDSNLDWGQDLYRLPKVVDQYKLKEPIWLLYFGHVDPDIYGLKYKYLPSQPIKGLIAVSINFFKGYPYIITAPNGSIAMVGADYLKWMADLKPIDRVGSILIFDTR